METGLRQMDRLDLPPDPFLAFVELTNTGSDTVSLDTLSIQNFNNGNTTTGFDSTLLSGDLESGETYYFAYESAPTDPSEFSAFEVTYGFAPNQFAGGKFVNGDDTVILFNTQYIGDSVVDPANVDGRLRSSGDRWYRSSLGVHRHSSKSPYFRY